MPPLLALSESALAITVSDPLLLALASATTALTVAILISMFRSMTPRPPQRRAADREHVEDPLAMLGRTLAATHDPRALLPVIVEAVTQATGAAGGRVEQGGREVVSVGRRRGNAVVLPLGAEDQQLTLALYPPAEGFDAESSALARWLTAQATIALENARLHHVVRLQAMTDDLTRLANRRGLLSMLDAEVERIERFGGSVAIVLADLDDFKAINDRFGHPAGDEALQAFGDLLQSQLRETDVAARVGGDEFALALPETSLEGALAIAERLRRLTRTIDLRGGGVRVTASFGVAASDGDGASVEDLLQRADAALYRAKTGKDRVAAAAVG